MSAASTIFPKVAIQHEDFYSERPSTSLSDIRTSTGCSMMTYKGE